MECLISSDTFFFTNLPMTCGKRLGGGEREESREQTREGWLHKERQSWFEKTSFLCASHTHTHSSLLFVDFYFDHKWTCRRRI